MRSLALPLALVGVSISGCGSASDKRDVVNVGAVSSDLTVHPLSDGTQEVVPVTIAGLYGGDCKLHAGQWWELTLDTADRDLEVVLNEEMSRCSLTLYRIWMAPVGGGSLFDLYPNPPIVLDRDYAAEPTKLTFVDSSLAFFANAKIEGLAAPVYTNDFGIHLVYSDDARLCYETAPPAIYDTVSASADSAAVAPPDYEVTFDGLQLVVDARKVVQDSSEGNVVLVPGEQGAEEWKVFEEGFKCCEGMAFADIHALFTGGDEIAEGEIAGGKVALGWKQFALLGERLPEGRVLILKHTGEGGVMSYELIRIIFPGPVPVAPPT